MSETVIEPVEFQNKSGEVFILDYQHNLWKIYRKDWVNYGDDIADFKLQSKAVKFCELLKESE
jgi:hypothetical protein